MLLVGIALGSVALLGFALCAYLRGARLFKEEPGLPHKGDAVLVNVPGSGRVLKMVEQVNTRTAIVSLVPSPGSPAADTMHLTFVEYRSLVAGNFASPPSLNQLEAGNVELTSTTIGVEGASNIPRGNGGVVSESPLQTFGVSAVDDGDVTEHKDPNGSVYFSNSKTGKTGWKREDVVSAEQTVATRAAAEAGEGPAVGRDEKAAGGHMRRNSDHFRSSAVHSMIAQQKAARGEAQPLAPLSI
jgi:hypothetical protein